MVPLRHKLRNGDQVEIITGSKINLNPDWMDDVVTHKAKSRIRQFIKQKQRKVADIGREIGKSVALKLNWKLSDQELTRVVRKFKYESTQGLFFDLGSGSIELTQVFKEAKKFKSTGKIDAEEDHIQDLQDRHPKRSIKNTLMQLGPMVKEMHLFSMVILAMSNITMPIAALLYLAMKY